ncbi:MAG: hypothetical protein NVS2B8_19710 [Vulcanimicrobiaceae bacterium]
MRPQFEFQLHLASAVDATGHPDAALALLGSLGWELRGIAAAPGGGYVVALQRTLGEEHPLPDSLTLAASLEEPLAAPSREEMHGEESAV